MAEYIGSDGEKTTDRMMAAEDAETLGPGEEAVPDYQAILSLCDTLGSLSDESEAELLKYHGQAALDISKWLEPYKGHYHYRFDDGTLFVPVPEDVDISEWVFRYEKSPPHRIALDTLRQVRCYHPETGKSYSIWKRGQAHFLCTFFQEHEVTYTTSGKLVASKNNDYLKMVTNSTSGWEDVKEMYVGGRLVYTKGEGFTLQVTDEKVSSLEHGTVEERFRNIEDSLGKKATMENDSQKSAEDVRELREAGSGEGADASTSTIRRGRTMKDGTVDRVRGFGFGPVEPVFELEATMKIDPHLTGELQANQNGDMLPRDALKNLRRDIGEEWSENPMKGIERHLNAHGKDLPPLKELGNITGDAKLDDDALDAFFDEYGKEYMKPHPEPKRATGKTMLFEDIKHDMLEAAKTNGADQSFNTMIDLISNFLENSDNPAHQMMSEAYLKDPLYREMIKMLTALLVMLSAEKFPSQIPNAKLMYELGRYQSKAGMHNGFGAIFSSFRQIGVPLLAEFQKSIPEETKRLFGEGAEATTFDFQGESTEEPAPVTEPSEVPS